MDDRGLLRLLLIYLADGLWVFMLLGMLIFAVGSQRCRHILCWVAVPQIVLWGELIAGLALINSPEGYFVMMFTPPAMAAALITAMLTTRKLKRPGWYVWGCHGVFLAIMFCWVAEERIIYAIERDWQEYNTARLYDQAKQQGMGKLNGSDCYSLGQEFIQAAKDRDVMESTLRYFAEKNMSPFLSLADICVGEPSVPDISSADTPFIIALRHFNLRFVRYFSPQLTGMSTRAQQNRHDMILSGNPLLELYGYSDAGWNSHADQKTAALEMAKLLLAMMPELLTDKIYQHVIEKKDTAALAFFMRQHPPENRLYRLEVLALLPDINTLMAEIIRDPSLLDISLNQTWYQDNLLYFIINSGDIAVIHALIDANIIDWRRTMTEEKNIPLIWAVSRLDDNKQDREVLASIIRNMLTQHALPETQIAVYLRASPTLPAVLVQAGVPCTQLYAMAVNASDARMDKKVIRQRLNAFCLQGERSD